MEIGRSGRVQVEDIVFLVRKDAKKYARVKELLMMNEELKKARKAFDEGKFAGKNANISIKNIGFNKILDLDFTINYKYIFINILFNHNTFLSIIIYVFSVLQNYFILNILTTRSSINKI